MATDTPQTWLWPPATEKDRLCWRTLKFRGYLPRHTKSTVFLPPSATVIKGPPVIHSLPILSSCSSGSGGQCRTSPPSPGSAHELAELLPPGLRRPAPRPSQWASAPRASAPEPLSPSLCRRAPPLSHCRGASAARARRAAAAGPPPPTCRRAAAAGTPPPSSAPRRRVVRALGAGVTWPGAGAAATPAAPLPRRLSRAAPRRRLCRLASHLGHAAAPLPRLRRDSHRPPTRATASLVSALLPAGAGVAARSMVGRVWTPWRAPRRW